MHEWRANLPAKGVVSGTLAAGTVFGSMRACFWESGQIYVCELVCSSQSSKAFELAADTPGFKPFTMLSVNECGI